MSKIVENFRKNVKSELGKATIVVVSAAGGMFIAKGIRTLTEKHPTLDTVAKYATPLVFGLGGIAIAACCDEKSKIKYVGYGLAAAGGIEAVKLIPVVKDYIHGILGETEIPAGSAFYSESEDRQRLMSGFGYSGLPIGNTMMQEASQSDYRLPELQGSDDPELQGPDDERSDLGYNGDATEDVDPLSGII